VVPLRITVTGPTTDAVRAMYLIGLLLQVDNDSVQVEQRTLPTVACVTASVEVPDSMPLPDLAQQLAANGHRLFGGETEGTGPP
jgi:hypothetical protein